MLVILVVVPITSREFFKGMTVFSELGQMPIFYKYVFFYFFKGLGKDFEYLRIFKRLQNPKYFRFLRKEIKVLSGQRYLKFMTIATCPIIVNLVHFFKFSDFLSMSPDQKYIKICVTYISQEIPGHMKIEDLLWTA